LDGCRKLGIGRSARRRKAWFDALFQNSIEILARLMRRGWATRFPVNPEMFVLSEERIVPRRVAPGSNFS